MLKLWQIANLGHKRQLQNLAFPDGIVWNKETNDIEPLSKNEFRELRRKRKRTNCHF